MTGDVLLRLGLDCLAVAVLAYGLFLPRHGRMDLAVLYVLFNFGLFVALIVITRASVTLGIGLGLFAVLSMVRLRSETFGNRELAYFFVALVIALVTAIDMGQLPLAVGLTAATLAATWAADHPRVSRPTRRLEITLEMVFSDQEALRRHLEERLNAHVVEARLLEIDYVRETTRALVRYVESPRGRTRVTEEAVDGSVAVPGR